MAYDCADHHTNGGCYGGRQDTFSFMDLCKLIMRLCRWSGKEPPPAITGKGGGCVSTTGTCYMIHPKYECNMFQR